MAEFTAVIGAAAAVIQLIDYARKMRGCTLGVTDGFGTLDDLTVQVQDMKTVLARMKTGTFETQCSATIERCSDKLTKLSELVGKLSAAKKNGFRARLRSVGLWLRKEQEITSLMNDIFDREFGLLRMFLLLHEGQRTFAGPTGAWKLCIPSITLPPKNIHFVGQADILNRIKDRVELAKSHTRLGIHGLGGIGKSQLAIEVAHRLAVEFPIFLTLFVHASSELECESDYIGSARSADTICTTRTFALDTIRCFVDAEPSGRWLLIIDGVDASETLLGLKEFFNHLSRDANGTIIFTSRNRDLILELVEFDSASVFHLHSLSEEHAVELLTCISDDVSTNTDFRKELVEELQCLPLAVMQAATFIRKKPIDVFGYLDLYRGDEVEKFNLLDSATDIHGAKSINAVTTIWGTTLDQIESSCGYASQLIRFLACLHPRAIPYCLLLTEANGWFDVVSALGSLEAFSMIHTNNVDKIVHIHSLVHFVLRQRLKATHEFVQGAQRAFKAIYQTFPSNFRSKALLDRGHALIFHAQTVLDDSESLGIEQLDLGLKIYSYLRTIGDFAYSMRIAEWAVQQSRTLSGEGSYICLEALNELALVHLAKGNYHISQTITEEVLARRKREFNGDHPDVLASLNNLGIVLRRQGRWKEAEIIHRNELEAKERVLGPFHDSTIKSINSLALSLQDQEKYTEAEKLLRKAASIRQSLYETSNTATLLSLNNLAVVLQLQGKFSEAGQIYSTVFDTRKDLLGPKHQATLRSRGNMALNLLQQEQYTKAQGILAEVLEGLVETLGTNHIETLDARANLANALIHLHNPYEAERMFRKVFHAKCELLGENHPDTKSCERLMLSSSWNTE